MSSTLELDMLLEIFLNFAHKVDPSVSEDYNYNALHVGLTFYPFPVENIPQTITSSRDQTQFRKTIILPLYYNLMIFLETRYGRNTLELVVPDLDLIIQGIQIRLAKQKKSHVYGILKLDRKERAAFEAQMIGDINQTGTSANIYEHYYQLRRHISWQKFQSEILADKMSATEQELTDCEARGNDLDKLCEEKEQDILNLETKIAQSEHRHEDLILNCQTLQDQIVQWESNDKKQRLELDEKDKQLLAMEDQLEKAEAELTELREQLSTKHQDTIRLNKELVFQDLQTTHSALAQKYENIREELSQYKKLHTQHDQAIAEYQQQAAIEYEGKIEWHKTVLDLIGFIVPFIGEVNVVTRIHRKQISTLEYGFIYPYLIEDKQVAINDLMASNKLQISQLQNHNSELVELANRIPMLQSRLQEVQNSYSEMQARSERQFKEQTLYLKLQRSEMLLILHSACLRITGLKNRLTSTHQYVQRHITGAETSTLASSSNCMLENHITTLETGWQEKTDQFKDLVSLYEQLQKVHLAEVNLRTSYHNRCEELLQSYAQLQERLENAQQQYNHEIVLLRHENVQQNNKLEHVQEEHHINIAHLQDENTKCKEIIELIISNISRMNRQAAEKEHLLTNTKQENSTLKLRLDIAEKAAKEEKETNWVALSAAHRMGMQRGQLQQQQQQQQQQQGN
ncbi:hypothetical protein R3P38DRAFT_2799618 [Favolaschia claudopus]|uniref:Uncharacterized protein n=1 Tax=Favolaschia claudopus TaxID=2862362 RepID=A0AAW0A0L2_9AGAR